MMWSNINKDGVNNIFDSDLLETESGNGDTVSEWNSDSHRQNWKKIWKC